MTILHLNNRSCFNTINRFNSCKLSMYNICGDIFQIAIAKLQMFLDLLGFNSFISNWDFRRTVLHNS